ncbi:hypothetical protein HF086_003379 [Spodoptera exigua]|uniref:CCHC-type domain-containing protein n=1 Tax=Spodoptera exigua TaxID=7107 RepID=A0A922SRD3_SPOEX|nr:hypothetical protein HF086_003379 [Spodoptera exigua]
MASQHPSGDNTPTAAVGSQSPLLCTSGSQQRPEPTFTMREVMDLVSTITKNAATSAVTAALSASSTPTITIQERGNFYLPPFDPDVRSHDIRDWCANVDENIAAFNIPQQEARMKAILQLKGRAKTWADTWSLTSTTWQQVKEDLIRTFGKEFRYADDVQKWRNYTSDQANSYAEYATTGWTLFKRVRPEAEDSEIIDALITGIYPEFIRSELLRNTPGSLPSLVSVLKTFRKRKIESNSESSNKQYKKPRVLENSTKMPICCFNCNKPGHIARDCKAKLPLLNL